MTSALRKLILYPENSLNWFITSKTAGIDLLRFILKSSMSSAYKDILWIISSVEIQLIFGLFLLASVRGSMIIRNDSGDNGHPCLVPLPKGKYEEDRPLIRTVASGLLYYSLTQLLKVSLSPKVFRVEKRKRHLSLSKAFSASRLITILDNFCWRDNWITFKNLLILLQEFLPITKPVWSGLLIEGRTFSRRCASVLDNILKSTFKRLMRLYKEHSSAAPL